MVVVSSSAITAGPEKRVVVLVLLVFLVLRLLAVLLVLLLVILVLLIAPLVKQAPVAYRELGFHLHIPSMDSQAALEAAPFLVQLALSRHRS